MSVQDKTDFTQGSIIRKMLPFMGPILGALILQAAYGAVDLLVVGRFGSTAGLSAVSTGSQVLNLVTFVITALAMGVTVLIARYIGEKNTDQIGELLGGATTIFAILAVVLAVVMVTFARPLSVLMQAPAEAVTLTSSYVKDMWRRNIFHYGLQCAHRDIQRFWRQQITSYICVCGMYSKCYR